MVDHQNLYLKLFELSLELATPIPNHTISLNKDGLFENLCVIIVDTADQTVKDFREFPKE